MPKGKGTADGEAPGIAVLVSHPLRKSKERGRGRIEVGKGQLGVLYHPAPNATYRLYPNLFINASNTSAVSRTPNPSSSLASLNPVPGTLGATT